MQPADFLESHERQQDMASQAAARMHRIRALLQPMFAKVSLESRSAELQI